MPSIVRSESVESALRKDLNLKGYTLNKTRLNGETGVDILAKRSGEELYIEVIGFKSSPPARSMDFFQVFFRAISRTKDGAKRSIIALPIQWRNGLPIRARVYGSAWRRLGNAFPEIEIWLIDVNKELCKRTKWNDWAA